MVTGFTLPLCVRVDLLRYQLNELSTLGTLPHAVFCSMLDREDFRTQEEAERRAKELVLPVTRIESRKPRRKAAAVTQPTKASSLLLFDLQVLRYRVKWGAYGSVR